MADRELASQRLLAVTEEELNRIVLDIHDGPVQNLFAALSLLTRLEHSEAVLDDPNAAMLLSRSTQLVEGALREIKTFLGTFRPPEFHRRSVEEIVQNLVLQHESWTGHTVEFATEPIHGDLLPPAKIALYRILQEGLSNAFRHSGGDKQWVRLWSEEGMIWLEIEDNGHGFDPPPLEGPSATEREEHIGLRGMRDRVKLVGGTFDLHSAKGQGTRITVRIPYVESEQSA
jgi:signal transduction histidine kinase